MSRHAVIFAIATLVLAFASVARADTSQGERLFVKAAPMALPPLDLTRDRIRIVAVEIEPACDVDRARLDRAAHPTAPWLLRDWLDVAVALGTPNATNPVDARLDGPASLIAAACRASGQPPISHAIEWRRVGAGFALHYR